MKNTNRLFFALLAAAALLFAAGCSSDGDDSDDTITASDLAGTTWVYSTKDGDETHTLAVKFESGGKVTWSSGSYDKNGSLIEGQGWSDTCTYSVSGSTVILYDEDGDVFVQFTYSSGNLSYTIEDAGESFTYIYTKVS